jgi:hypothetical protein
MKKDLKKPKKKSIVSMDLINPNAAGIDVGATLFSIAVPPGRDTVSVKEFTAFTWIYTLFQLG